jgi:hypothetical protein
MTHVHDDACLNPDTLQCDDVTEGDTMLPLDATGPATMYTVAWHWRTEPTRAYRDTVRIIDGYTTTDDIPRILAVKATGRVSDAAEVVIVSTQLQEGCQGHRSATAGIVNTITYCDGPCTL